MPLTEPERAKHYWVKYREKVCEQDNLRKNNQRKLLTVLNTEANKETSKNQRITKAIYRQKRLRKLKKKLTIHSEPSHSQSPLGSSTFSHPSTKARILRKVTSALSKSPRKKVEIVKCLAKQIKLEIKYDNQPTVGCPKNNLTDDEVEWLGVFFKRSDITYTLPGNEWSKKHCKG